MTPEEKDREWVRLITEWRDLRDLRLSLLPEPELLRRDVEKRIAEIEYILFELDWT